ncbi:MAG: cation diffusion facilitator family transporter [Lachnospiraceae bacterium]|nr:cation diffusion facilitator family transporter [Lachnospiraceae bacterium]
MDVEGEAKNRDKIIVKTSIIGIVANVFLAAFKAVVGLVSNSIAVTLDAVNNLSDALSSVITIVGTKLANRHPDKKHPLGHGRIEYLSAMIVAAIVLYAGITAGIESVKKIIYPEKADYSVVSLVIISVAIVVKIVLGIYVKKMGQKAKSGALEASGADASFDAILSASVLASAIIYMIFGLSLEAYVGVIIAGFIIKSGFEMMKDTLDDILGHRPDAELSKKIKSIINEEPEVRGAYDLMINDYGPDKNYASVHIEVPDTMNASEIDELTRKLEANVYTQTGVVLTAVGVYSYNTKNDEATAIRNYIQSVVLGYDWAIQFHGFYVDIDTKVMRFDVVMSFDIKPSEGINILHDDISKKYPDYKIYIVSDVDMTD